MAAALCSSSLAHSASLAAANAKFESSAAARSVSDGQRRLQASSPRWAFSSSALFSDLRIASSNAVLPASIVSRRRTGGVRCQNGASVGVAEKVRERDVSAETLLTTVMKFGGSSVASAERMREVANVILSFPEERPIIVLSAMGKTTNNLLKVGSLTSGAKTFGRHCLGGLFMGKGMVAGNVNLREF